jgi:hypothetical protein
MIKAKQRKSELLETGGGEIAANYGKAAQHQYQ